MCTKLVLAEGDKPAGKLSPRQSQGWCLSFPEAFCRDSRRASRQVTLFTVQNRMAEVITVIILNDLDFRISRGMELTVTKTSNAMPLRLVLRVPCHFLVFQLQTTFGISLSQNCLCTQKLTSFFQPCSLQVQQVNFCKTDFT